MNLNLLAYLIYGIITVYTIVYVGKVLHSNGRHFVLQIFTDKAFGDYVNNALLVGYYLFNIGYVFVTLSSWRVIENEVELLEMISQRTGVILLLLGGLHFMNIIGLQFIAWWKQKEVKG